MKHLCLEFAEKHGKCMACDGATVLVTVTGWKTHPVDETVDDEFVEPAGEVAGHYCQTCDRLTAIFLNSL